MKLRVQNPSREPLQVVLEPWANAVFVEPGSSVWVVTEGAVPEHAYFDVAAHEDSVVITPDWEGALAHLCDVEGNKLD